MNSKFESTREKDITCSASQAVIRGIASDGGLFVRRDMENLKINISELKGKKYTEIAEIILSIVLDDYPEKNIKYCVENAYDKKFNSDDITPLVKVGNDYILELFHGPTSAFKDMALSILPYLSTEALKLNKIKEKILILTATSGDTGKAALEGFKNIEGIKILVFFPNDGVSKVQEKQMITQEGNNTYVYAINGNFDDAQSEVKKIFTDEEIKEKLKKKNDIQTYKEIVAFTEGKKLDELHKAVEVGKRPYQNILKVIISAGVTAMICFLIGVLMHVFLN